MIIYTKKQRKDGKVPATFSFDSGKQIKKLLAPHEYVNLPIKYPHAVIKTASGMTL